MTGTPPASRLIEALSRKAPPQDLEAERSILGAALQNIRALDDLAEALRPDDFYHPAHQIIFSAMLELQVAGKPVDILTVNNATQAAREVQDLGGAVYLAELADPMIMPGHVPAHAQIVAEHSMRRRIETACFEVLQSVRNPEVDSVSLVGSTTQALAGIVGRASRSDVASTADITVAVMDELEERAVSGKSRSGISTGFADLDSMLGGWRGPDLVLIAGRPGMGKTSFGLGSAVRAALQGVPSLFFTLEMSKEQLVERALCGLAKANTHRLRSGRITPAEMEPLRDAADKLYSAPFYLDETPAIRLVELQAKARRMVREKGVQLIFVDYLTLVQANATERNREQEVSALSAGLKALAKELRIPVVALAQINREATKRTDKRPVLSDLRESGALEQDADIVGFVFNEEYAKNGRYLGNASKTELLIRKNRHGACGVVNLTFFPESSSFENHAEPSALGY